MLFIVPLLEGKQVSKFHKLKSDELWHFYDGTSIKIYIFNDSMGLSEIVLGNNLDKGEIFQIAILQNSKAEMLKVKNWS